MIEAYRQTRKDGAPGVDGVTAAEYEANLGANLQSLLDRIKSGRYVAPPVRRHYIPKADGTKRPLGIPTLEDKVAQRAILLLLEPIYETDFLSCSYGFRPGRSAHDALRALRDGFMEQGLRWVVDVDIAKYLDASSYCPLVFFRLFEEVCGSGRRLYSKAFSTSATDMDSLEVAALYTLQDSLARNAEKVHGLKHGDVSFWRLFDETRAQLVGKTNAPRRAGGELLSGDKTVIQPAMQGRGRKAEFLRSLVDRQEWSVYGLISIRRRVA